MPGGRFGGSGDYGGFFQSIYGSNKQTKDAVQAAKDQDALDQWQNGLMEDDAWLAYIADREIATRSDPKQHEQWVTAGRKYATVVSDNKAEFAFKNGGSINDLIAYYQTRLGAMQQNSQEYRDLQVHVNDLQDQRSQTRIQDGANAIIDRINKGKGTYQELQAFLQDNMAQTRANSDLQKSLKDQIKSVSEQIRTGKLEGSFEKLQYQYDAGKLSGRTYSKNLRSMAQQFKNTDPKRYYQIMEAAVALDKRGGGFSSGGGGGGGTGGSGGSGGSSTQKSKKTINASIDKIQGERNRLQAITAQYDKDPAHPAIDPVSGKAIVWNEGTIKSYDTQLVGTFDKLAHAYKLKGDVSAQKNTLKAKSAYVAGKITDHNTMALADSEQHLLETTTKLVQHAYDDGDPVSAMNTLKGLAQDWSTFGKKVTNVSVPGKSFAGDLKKRLPAEEGGTAFGGARGPMDQIDSGVAAKASSLAHAFTTMADPNATEADMGAALQAVGAAYGQGQPDKNGNPSDPWVVTGILKPGLEIKAREESVRTGSGQLVRVVNAKGKIEWVPTTPQGHDTMVNGQWTHVVKNVPNVPVDNQSSKLVDIFVDINGTPTKVQAVATLASNNMLRSWALSKAVNGVPAGSLTKDQIKTLQKSGKWDALIQSGAVSSVPAVQYWTVQTPASTDKYGNHVAGQTWVQDIGSNGTNGTNKWYANGLPIRSYATNDDGSVQVDDKGQPMIDYKSNSDAAGVAVPYGGGDPRAMQAIASQPGAIDYAALGIRGRDLNGMVTDSPSADLMTDYFDPRGGSSNTYGWESPDNRDYRSAAVAKTQTDYVKDYQRQGGVLGVHPGKEADDFAPIQKAADDLGINLNGAKSAHLPGHSGGGSGSKLNLNFNPAGLQVGTTDHPGKDRLELPTVQPKTYSGEQTKTGIAVNLPHLSQSAQFKRLGEPLPKPTPAPKAIKGRAPVVKPKPAPAPAAHPSRTNPNPGNFRGV